MKLLAVLPAIVLAWLLGRNRGRYEAFAECDSLAEMAYDAALHGIGEDVPPFVQDQRDNAGWQ